MVSRWPIGNASRNWSWKKEINHSKKEKKETEKDDRLCTSFCELQGNQPAEKETELVLASDVVDISYQCTTEIFSIQTEKNTDWKHNGQLVS